MVCVLDCNNGLSTKRCCWLLDLIQFGRSTMKSVFFEKPKFHSRKWLKQIILILMFLKNPLVQITSKLSEKSRMVTYTNCTPL